MFIDLNVLFRRHHRTAFVLGTAWDGEALQFVTRPAHRVLVVTPPGSGGEDLVGANLSVLGCRGDLLVPGEVPDPNVQQLFVNDVQPWTTAALTARLAGESCAMWVRCESLAQLASHIAPQMTSTELMVWARTHFDLCVIFSAPGDVQQETLALFCPEWRRAPDWWQSDRTQGVRGVMVSEDAPTFLLGLPLTDAVLVQGRRVKAPLLQRRS